MASTQFMIEMPNGVRLDFGTQGIANGVFRIAHERWRHVHEEGYSAAHDDDHSRGEIASAAAAYAVPPDRYVLSGGRAECNLAEALWPFDQPMKNPEVDSIDSRIRSLEKAGAMCAAEIDRLLRLQGRL